MDDVKGRLAMARTGARRARAAAVREMNIVRNWRASLNGEEKAMWLSGKTMARQWQRDEEETGPSSRTGRNEVEVRCVSPLGPLPEWNGTTTAARLVSILRPEHFSAC